MMNRFAAAVVLLAAVELHAPAQASEQAGWQFEVTPYGWLMGVDGDVAVRDREANFEKDFSDLKDNVDAGFMGLFAASYNRFVLFGQYDYAALSTDGSLRRDLGLPVPPGGGVKGKLDTKIGTLGIGYRFDMFGENTLDVLVGVRDLRIETKLSRMDDDVRSREMNVTDTLIMLRPSFRLSDRWRFNPTISYAVGGDSDTHYEFQPEFQYQFADSFALRIGYRALSYKMESGARGAADYRAFDGSLSGFLIGVGWTFPPYREAVAAAPAPARPPEQPQVAAAPPPDADRDGVPDASDRCPTLRSDRGSMAMAANATSTYSSSSRSTRRY